ncbi:MAG TPA: hypothetical protein VFR81_11455 [Longimicrobium sp.]|nr:hypothetical protein [Longimicrobium sp.]
MTSRSIHIAPSLLLALAAVAGCTTRSADADAPPLTGCTVASAGVPLPRALEETSGAAFSRRAPGVWWSINDSGNPPELFALDSAGRRLGQVRVRAAENLDWEDMAAGPCAGGAGDCLYVADIGDNDNARGSVTVYRVPEPAPGDASTAHAEVFHARYPNGPRDAEGFFVLPDGGAYVVTKGTREPVELYRYPLEPGGGTGVMERVRVLDERERQPPDRVTGAAATVDGSWIAIRTYVGLELYRREDLFGSGQPALTTSVKSLDEKQGEAVAIAPGGRVLLTTEGAGGRGPGASRLSCPMP